MALVLQLTRRLTERPSPPQLVDVDLRHFSGQADIPVWLDLRRRAFARQKLGVRDWDAADFSREYLAKPWWRPEAVWLAQWQPAGGTPQSVGSVTLARRGEAANSRPVVHWLLVLPTHRRRGIGRLLLATLEATVWDEGHRQVWLETHSQWREALALYQSLGYEPA